MAPRRGATHIYNTVPRTFSPSRTPFPRGLRALSAHSRFSRNYMFHLSRPWALLFCVHAQGPDLTASSKNYIGMFSLSLAEMSFYACMLLKMYAACLLFLHSLGVKHCSRAPFLDACFPHLVSRGASSSFAPPFAVSDSPSASFFSVSLHCYAYVCPAPASVLCNKARAARTILPQLKMLTKLPHTCSRMLCRLFFLRSLMIVSFAHPYLRAAAFLSGLNRFYAQLQRRRQRRLENISPSLYGPCASHVSMNLHGKLHHRLTYSSLSRFHTQHPARGFSGLILTTLLLFAD